MINIPISIGELIDKLSILQVKKIKINNPEKLSYVNNEYNLLHKLSVPFFEKKEIYNLYYELIYINTKLWDIEDRLRIIECENRFDDEFIDCARKVYFINDERYELKNKINHLTDSEIKEIKEYVKYK